MQQKVVLLIYEFCELWMKVDNSNIFI
jgi:hypothetical protein